jgi:membrane fusion protein, multidrug efflux system
VVAAVALWWHSTFSEDTDDAQVNGHLIQVSSRISGQVLKVDVEENQVVKAGRHHCRAGPQGLQRCGGECRGRPGQRASQCRRSQRERAHHVTINTGSNLCVRRCGCERCAFQRGAGAEQLGSGARARDPGQANNVKAQADLERYKPLVEKDVISKQQFDAAVAAADADQAAVADARATERAAQRCNAGSSGTGVAGAGGSTSMPRPVRSR